MYKFRCESEVGCIGDCCIDCSGYCNCNNCVYSVDCPRAFTDDRCEPEEEDGGY